MHFDLVLLHAQLLIVVSKQKNLANTDFFKVIKPWPMKY